MSTGNRPPGAFSRALRAVAAGPRPLRAWVDVDDLPWGDPDFSQRMLREHLDESHGAASRRPAEIARQVDLLAAWLGGVLAPGGEVLDVTCGPGLVARELAGRGLRVTGVDIGPAAIRHARQLCAGLPCAFLLADVREMELPVAAFDAALYLFGQPTVQREGDLAAALRTGGRLAMEILRAEAIGRSRSTSWWTGSGGLWGAGEHLVLYERDGRAPWAASRSDGDDADQASGSSGPSSRARAQRTRRPGSPSTAASSCAAVHGSVIA